MGEAKDSLSSGALAGLASVLILQPLDVLKTRLQETPRTTASWNERITGVLRGTLKQDGILGFWRGTCKNSIV
jgi:solute carrier family 25 protein 38